LSTTMTHLTAPVMAQLITTPIHLVFVVLLNSVKLKLIKKPASAGFFLFTKNELQSPLLLWKEVGNAFAENES
jgi:hypothetical protein